MFKSKIGLLVAGIYALVPISALVFDLSLRGNPDNFFSADWFFTGIVAGPLWEVRNYLSDGIYLANGASFLIYSIVYQILIIVILYFVGLGIGKLFKSKPNV